MIQTCILAAIVVFSICCDFVQGLASIIKIVGVNIDELPMQIRIAAAYGRWPLSAVVFFGALFWIRTANKDAVINPDNNIYHDHAHISYLFAL